MIGLLSIYDEACVASCNDLGLSKRIFRLNDSLGSVIYKKDTSKRDRVENPIDHRSKCASNDGLACRAWLALRAAQEGS